MIKQYGHYGVIMRLLKIKGSKGPSFIYEDACRQSVNAALQAGGLQVRATGGAARSVAHDK
jgi:hypothetical protein